MQQMESEAQQVDEPVGEQERHIGQNMSYFYPFEVSLNKAHRNL